MTAKKKTASSALNRYTTLPVLLDILAKRSLTLLSPSTWEDRNDAYFLEQYKEQKGLLSLLALCFSTADQTFHHWKVFSQGISGVCIEFDRQSLIECIPKRSFLHRNVVYRKLTDLERRAPHTDELPFIKRAPYADEREFRIVYQSKTKNVDAIEVSLNKKSIRRITLSPWLPKTVANSVISAIRAIDGCEDLKIYRSTLIENERWKATASQ
jgi:hypothetical protein